jgi:phosphoglycolate phosphatase
VSLGLSKPKAVLFDWDNTLIDSWPVLHEAANRTFQTFGMPLWTLEEAKRNIARSLRDAFPEMFGARWEEAREVYYRSFAAIHLERLTPLPAAEELLKSLAERAIPLAVVSNKTGHFLRAEAETLGWSRYFACLIGAADAKRDKPAPDPVFKALEALAMPPSREIWFVGDGKIDVDCAINAGCLPILLREQPPSGEEFADSQPIYVRDCRELAAKIMLHSSQASPLAKRGHTTEASVG